MAEQRSGEGEVSLKIKTARTLKWNTIDRLASQVLYGVVGVVLANELSQEDFGLVGALFVFQAFALIFADSGFGAALLQKKNPTEEDYSTVFWFNLVVSVGIYWILWFGAPLIADIFQGDRRLIPLSKVMFLTFVLNALGIVQTNRLMKRMDVRMIAVANVVGQTVGGALGIALALGGFGAWALVWQSVVQAGLRTGVLWASSGWRPTCWIKMESLRQIWRIGLSVFSSAMLSAVFLNIYSFVIGAAYSLKSLGVYTQADKWSKMGSASLSQVLTATFIPLLSRVQDSEDDYRRYVRRINRFTAFILFPAMIGLAAIGRDLFHTLFGEKWDAAIIMFQILTIRGIFIVLVSLYGNYMLAKGYGKRLFKIEVIKDVAIAVAIVATIFEGSVDWLVWGQLWASVGAWIVVVRMTSRAIGYGVRNMIADLVPFLTVSMVMWGVCLGVAAIGGWLINGGHVDVSGASASTGFDGVALHASSTSAGFDSVSLGATSASAGFDEISLDATSASAGFDEVSLGASSTSASFDEAGPSMGINKAVIPASASADFEEAKDVSSASIDEEVGTDLINGREWYRIASGIVTMAQILIGGVVYLLIAKLCHFPELQEATGYLFGRFRRKRN